MSGHSKWANIKRKKGAADAQKGKIFTKLGREIQVAVREGGGPDPASNSKLKDIISKAKAANMPNDNIQRSIKKAMGEGSAENIEEIVYEGYGPGGIAVIVEVMTDNRNRTASDVRHIFDKNGGNLGSSGCVSFMFDKKGLLIVANDGSRDEEEVMMDALDSGAEDFTSTEETFEIMTAPTDFSAVRDALEEKGYVFETAELSMIPQNYSKLEDEAQIAQMEKMLDMLDDNDDVMEVYHNWETDDE
ncbi:MAG: YebC/PmpR family DNA-binding transcriptional regulator [Ruminococcaceae bacterium]|nr:YebC/PmpR family DNA-binding transcriptional regulator [Oscillospiraceae bacterium]